MAELDKAVRIQPGEGQFWELRGHAWQMAKDNSNAEKAFSTAINKNDNYFQHWLARGLLRKEVGDVAGAESDLKRSHDLLPTETAAYALGEFAERQHLAAQHSEMQCEVDAGKNHKHGDDPLDIRRVILANRRILGRKPARCHGSKSMIYGIKQSHRRP